MALSVQAGLPATNFGNTIDNEARKTVYAGSLKGFVSNNVDDRIAARTASAKKDAMRLISDAWKRNEAIHKDIDDLNLQKKSNAEEKTLLESQYSVALNERAAVKEKYNVDPESEEQNDLDLLVKIQDWSNHVPGSVPPSMDDCKRFNEIKDKPLTAYQSEYLLANDKVGKTAYGIEIAKITGQQITQALTNAQSTIDKDSSMVKAQASAEEIMESLAETVKTMLIQDGVDKTRKEQEEAEERAEEKAKKQEELEERIDAAKADENRKQDEEREIIDGESDIVVTKVYNTENTKVDSDIAQAQKNIKDIVEKQMLLNDDLKGIEFDLKL